MEHRIKLTDVNGALVGKIKDPRHADGVVVIVNADEVRARGGEEWYATLVFDEGSGRSRKRHMKLIRRVGEGAEGLLPGLGEEFWVDPRQFRNIQIFVRAGRTIILRGPAGTGKTTFAERLAAAMDLKFAKIDVGVRAEAKQFFGEEGASEGATRFVLSDLGEFLDDAAKNGNGGVTHLVLLDEINRVHPKIISGALHGLFDDTRHVTIPTTHGPHTFTMPKNAAAMCTMNPNDPRFGGTFALDAAMLNRTVVVDMRYPPKEFEVELLIRRMRQGGHGELRRADAVRMVEAASALRETALKGQITVAPSPRNTQDCALLVAAGVPVAEAIEDVLLQPYEGSGDEPESERGIAGLVIASKDVQLADVVPLRR